MSQRTKKSETQNEPSFRVSRRNFLQAAGAGAAVAGTAAFGAVPFRASRAAAQGSWDQEADIVVVGSGAAALSAAAVAHSLGNSVIVLEKANVVGGTTGKSGGAYWVPNNSLMREAGFEDPKEDAIRYMARLAFPERYDAEDEQFGLSDHKYSLIEGFYDNGPVAVDTLAEIGALQSTLQMVSADEYMSDYYAELDENVAPEGRAILPTAEDGSAGVGSDLIRQLQAYADANDILIHLEHRVTAAVTNDAGEVIGVEVSVGAASDSEATPEDGGDVITFRANKGVIFGSGGFTHNANMVDNYLRGPIVGGCAVPTNEGDFITIAGALGSDFGNLKNGFLAEVVLEQALNFASVPNDVFMIPGHSMLVVNKFGERIYNEKKTYNERTHVHWVWDPATASWPNFVTVMIYDQQTADTFAGAYPIPAEGVEATYVISGETWEELATNIDERLATLTADTGNTRLNDEFSTTVAETVSRYNEMAEADVDEDFHRGETPIEGAFEQYLGVVRDDNGVVQTMAPLASEGPYYAILLAPGTLDTNGGPKVNTNSQVIDTKGNPIPGLYGAGNAVESPAGQAYWAAGGTLGPAIAGGYMAAVTANDEPAKSE